MVSTLTAVGTPATVRAAGALDHLILAPASPSIIAGGSQPFTAEGFDSANNDLGDVTGATTFTITPDGSCTGASCTASTAGAHTVKGTDGTAIGTTTLTVNPGALGHLILAPASPSIIAGGSQPFTAEGFDSANNDLGDVTGATTFTITPDGSCTGASCTATTLGAHTVKGTDGTAIGTTTLTVNPGALDHLILAPASPSIIAGGSQPFTAEGFDSANNDLGDVTGTTTFTIAGGTCAGNNCSATASGDHTVTGTEGAAMGSATLTVNPSVLNHVVLIATPPSSGSITAGASQAYNAEGFDSFGNDLGNVTTSTTFGITPDGSCAGATCTATTLGVHTVKGTDGTAIGTTTLTVNPGALDHLILAPASPGIIAGGNQAFTAEGFDSANNDLGDVTGATTFGITPNGSCTGASCTAAATGAHTVTGTDSGKTGTATLTVAPGALDHIVLAPPTPSIVAGASQAFTAEGFDSSNNSLGDVTGATTFTISPDGSCTAASCTATIAGAHTVTGTDAGKTSTATLTIAGGPLDHLVLNPASASIASGGNQAYTAEGFDSFNNDIGDVTTSTTFSISPNGSCTGASCTATATGPHTVTGTDAGKTGTATLTVNPGILDHIVLAPPGPTSIVAGTSQAYTAEGFDSSNNDIGNVTTSTTFTIAPNGSCTGASCTATAIGPHTVTGTDAAKTGTAPLTITPAALDHLVLAPPGTSIIAGASQAYTATGFDIFNNSLGTVTTSTSFTIAPNGSCTGASCTATAIGPHTVTGTDAGKTGTTTLTVTGGALDHLVLSPPGTSIIAGASQAYTATGFDIFSNSLGIVTTSTTFTIAPNGSCTAASCTATAAGVHTVTGTDAGKTGTTTLTITLGALDHLVLAPPGTSIIAGAGQTYTATGFDIFNNSIGIVTTATTFTIAPNGSCTGASCTATAAGVHTVTGTDAGKTGTTTLTVTGGALDHIVLAPPSTSIIAGASQAYTATGFDSFNNNLGVVTTSTAFTIAPNGSCTGASCTATAIGPHTVTGTDSGKTATATLTITPGALDHLVLSPPGISIIAGASQAYVATGFDSFNNNLGIVTTSTSFTIAPNGSCTGASCTATAIGPHTVTGTDTGKTGSATLTITPGPLDHLVLAPLTATVATGISQAYTAEGFDSFGNDIANVTTSTTFTITPNGSCTGASCTPSASGAHTVKGTDAGKTGTATLTATLTPTTTTSTPGSKGISIGGSNFDHATVTGDASNGSPSGTVSFFACGALTKASGCSSGGSPVGSVTLTAGANNTATAPSASFVPSAAGTWCFRAAYSGDSKYALSADGSSSECFNVAAPNDLVATGVPVSGKEGVSATVSVATLSDPASAELPGAFGVTITWGDGKSSAGTVSGSAGVYTVRGTHAYIDEGSFTFSVAISETDGEIPAPHANAVGQATIAEGDVMTPTAKTVTATHTVSFTKVVSGFTDAMHNVAADFTAVINWGDGTATSTGKEGGSKSTFTITGTHTYATAGTFIITVIAADVGATAKTTMQSTCTVA